MSQLLVPTHTYADSIPIGRRITEIMTEKGPSFTIAAMAKRLDINRETLRLMLKGEREIYTFELDKIAQDLKVPVERILQSDIAEESRQLKELLQTGDDHAYSLSLATKLAERAIGLTERVSTENDCAVAYYRLLDFERSCEMWKRMLPEAEVIDEKYGDPTLLLWITANLMTSKMALKDFSNMHELIKKAEPYFHTNPKTAGLLCYTIAKIKEDQEGDYVGAREKNYQMLEYYKIHGNLVNLARAQTTVAAFEYRQREYEKAYELQDSVLQMLQDHDDLVYRTIVYRDRAKILIRSNRTTEAVQLIKDILQRLEGTEIEGSEMVADFYLLLAVATNDPLYAEKMIGDQRAVSNIQKLAAKFIVDHYDRTGNLAAKMKYQTIMKKIRGTPLDLLLEDISMDPLTLLALHDFCHKLRWNLTE